MTGSVSRVAPKSSSGAHQRWSEGRKQAAFELFSTIAGRCRSYAPRQCLLLRQRELYLPACWPVDEPAPVLSEEL